MHKLYMNHQKCGKVGLDLHSANFQNIAKLDRDGKKGEMIGYTEV